MHVQGLRRPSAKVGGIVYFGRMLDKARLKAAGKLPAGYNTGTAEWYDFDARCCRFLGVDYAELTAQLKPGRSDRALLAWCFKHGRRPGQEENEIWNTFMEKRGWNDTTSASVQAEKVAAGLGDREGIVTWFGLFEADEAPPRGRKKGPASARRR